VHRLARIRGIYHGFVPIHYSRGVARRADISLLFDLFVTAQRVRRVLSDGMAKSGMRPDEYAVYSLLFEHGPLTATEMSELLGTPLTTVLDYLKAMSSADHLDRMPHPSDGRALQLRLSRSGVGAQKRANAHWEVVRKRLEGSLPMPIDQIRLALQALDDAALIAAAPSLLGRQRALGSEGPVGLVRVRERARHRQRAAAPRHSGLRV
jgi:DNA-binding MarR family transcriptional regulator